ncbi:MAG: peptidoglycan DD-metalloendopeptidase family protein [Thermodesulfobacteriota bacterium]|jgi:septal ring factor EnvC (AmiA/AmiB activator)|nr:MAG: peptidoglycan DD-metalloendopeptidase family protein [Thermodesulfobacteriota bacterium]
MNKKLLFFLALVFFWFFAFFGNLQAEEKKAPKEKKELKEIQKKIEDKQAIIKKAEKTEKKVISDLDTIEETLAQKQQELKHYEVNLKTQENEITVLIQQIEKRKAEAAEEEKFLADRIKILYRLGRLSFAKAIFSSDSFTTLMRRYDYLTRLIDYNVATINDYSQKLDLLQLDQQRLKEKEKELEGLTKQTRSVQKKILTHQEEKTNLLARVRSEKQLQLKALEELKLASQRLQGLIDKLDKQKAITSLPSAIFPSGYPFSLRGKLDFPVEGKVITFFGEHEDQEFATVSFNKGIEITAQLGSPIKAVLNGTVIYSGWFKGYGNIIIIDHSAGLYTLSGHVSELLKPVGTPVKTGETIALVGDTGSLKGSNLYFEIRHHGQPLDPLEWLKK